ncbi:MAG: PQQ-like beta-propeller repeat protein [Verrucomicrobia bacterium]|nr:PQQ-like beta-propeller repeat protein [Verrucomicrobiota bacterium]
MTKSRLLSGWLMCGLFALGLWSVAASDWPQWRGPNRDGVSAETGLLKEWPKGGPPLAWKATGVGAGYSSVSVVAGRIFAMGDVAGASSVIALDEKTGKLLWSAKVGGTGGGDGYPGPRCTPTVDGERVYAMNQFGDLVCVEAVTGKEVWRKNLTKDFGGRMMSGWGYSESPLVDGERLVCTPGGSKGTLLALDKKTGAVLWQSKDFTDNAAYSSVVAVKVGGVPQYIQLTDASVAGVAPQDGRLLWRAARAGRTAVIPTPVVHEDHVYVTSGYGVGCHLFKVGTSSPDFKAEQVYANKVMVNHHGGVVRLGEHLYGYSDGKGWTCQEFKTGKAVWQDKEKLGKGSLVYAEGHLYLRCQDGPGAVVLIEASPDGWKETGRFDQPDRSSANSWPHPVIANGKLYLRDQDVLLCYDVKAR